MRAGHGRDDLSPVAFDGRVALRGVDFTAASIGQPGDMDV